MPPPPWPRYIEPADYENSRRLTFVAEKLGFTEADITALAETAGIPMVNSVRTPELAHSLQGCFVWPLLSMNYQQPSDLSDHYDKMKDATAELLALLGYTLDDSELPDRASVPFKLGLSEYLIPHALGRFNPEIQPGATTALDLAARLVPPEAISEHMRKIRLQSLSAAELEACKNGFILDYAVKIAPTVIAILHALATGAPANAAHFSARFVLGRPKTKPQDIVLKSTFDALRKFHIQMFGRPPNTKRDGDRCAGQPFCGSLR